MTLKTIISLPVKIYEQCNYMMFTIEINKNVLTVTPYQSSNNKNTVAMLQSIVLCCEQYGIQCVPILFPLTFVIVKDALVCDMFYLFNIMSSKNTIDFIYNMITCINTTFECNYVLYTDMNITNLINVLQLHSNDNNVLQLHSNDEEIINTMLNKMFYRINRYINFCIAIMAQPNITSKNINQGSKINQIINIIKQSKIIFLGNTFTIDEHIAHIMNPKLLKKKRYYFYERNNKLFKTLYQEDHQAYLSAYPKHFNKQISIISLINTLITFNYRLLHNIVSKVLYRKKPEMITLLEQYIYDKNVDILYDIIKKPNNVNNASIYMKISYNKFTTIINIEQYDDTCFNNLLNNYTYPVCYDKKNLNEQFAKILYYCFIFYNKINFVAINNKAKHLLINVVKFYIALKDNNINIIHNSKYYIDNITLSVIKILLFNDTYKLLTIINNIETIQHNFLNNLIIIQILFNISWKTLYKQLDYFKYVVNMKDQCNDLIWMDGKLNKQYGVNMDVRLKKIIMDPLQMLNYLTTENDYYKWICEFKNLIGVIHYNTIRMDTEDYIQLSKILFLYSKIKNQSTDDKHYRKFINATKQYTRIILFNDRINIKLKELFKNININLGFLARDIVNAETITITNESSDTCDITTTINNLKKKYYKYKGKYLETKQYGPNRQGNTVKI